MRIPFVRKNRDVSKAANRGANRPKFRLSEIERLEDRLTPAVTVDTSVVGKITVTFGAANDTATISQSSATNNIVVNGTGLTATDTGILASSLTTGIFLADAGSNGGQSVNFNNLAGSAIVLGSGGGIQSTGIETVTFGAGSLALTGSGLDSNTNLVVTAFTTGTGTLDLNGKTPTVASVQLVSGSIIDTPATGSLTSTSTFDVRSGTISAVISGSVGLNKTTAGTVVLSGANSYTGTTNVSAGILNVRNNNALGTTAAGTVVTAGAALEMQNGITIGAEALTLNSSGYAYTGGQGFGALRGVSGTNVYQGAITLGSSASISADAGILSISNTIDATGATLTIGGLTGTTITVTGAIGGGATGLLTKVGLGTVTLTAANTYTGLTTVNAGTLNVGNGTTGSLNGTAGTALTFSGTGTINFNEGAGVSQSMGALTFSAGEGTITSTYGGSGTTTLTFGSLVARTAKATGNFTTSGGTLGTAGTPGTLGTNNIVITGQATGLVDKGLFFNDSDFAYNDQGGFLRAPVYGTDPNFINVAGGTATLGVNDATKNVRLTGNITGQTAASVNTLKIVGTVSFSQNGSTALTTSAIIASGAATFIGLTNVNSAVDNGGAELIIRPATSSDTISFGTKMTGAGGLTKGGAGTLTFPVQSTTTNNVNTYAGGLALNAGTLALASSSTTSAGSVTQGPAGLGVLTLAGGTIQTADTNARTLANVHSIIGDLTYNASGNGGLTLGGATNAVGSTTGNRIFTLAAAMSLIGSNFTPTANSTLTINTTGTGGFALSDGVAFASAGSTVMFVLNTGSTTSTLTPFFLSGNTGKLILGGSGTAVTVGAVNGAFADILEINSTTGGSYTFNSSTAQYTGGFVLTNGTVNLTANPFGTNPITLAGGTLSNNGSNRTITTDLTVSGNVTVNGGAFLFNSANKFFTGNNPSLTLNGNTTITNGWSIGGSNPSINFASGTMTLTSAAFTVAPTSGVFSITASVAANLSNSVTYSTAQTINVNGAGAVTIGNLTGSNLAITFTGTSTNLNMNPAGTPGLITIDGPTASFNQATSTYANGTTLKSGAITVGGAQPFGTNTLTLMSGSLRTNAARTVSNNLVISGDVLFTSIGGVATLAFNGSTFQLNASGKTLTFNGLATTFSTNPFNISSNDFNIVTSGTTVGSVSFNGGMTFSGARTISTSGTGQILIQGSLGNAGTQSLALTGTGSNVILGNSIAVSGTTAGITINGPTVTFGVGTSSFSGGVTLASGTLIYGGTSTGTAIGSGPLSITGSSTFRSDVANTSSILNRTITNALQINTSGTVTIGGLGANQLTFSGTNTIAGGPTLNFLGAPTTFGAVSTAGTINATGSGTATFGAISETTSPSGFVYNGTGGIVFKATNSYTGSTAINSGVLTFNPTATMSVAGNITGAGAVVLQPIGATLTLSGTGNTYSGGTTASGTGTTVVAAGSSLGTGNLTIAGGVVQLSASTNIAAGKSVTLSKVAGVRSVLSVTGDFLPTIASASTNGVIALDATSGATFNAAVANMATLGDGTLFLGSLSSGTFTGTLSAGAGSTYRLGGGGGSLTLSATGALSGGNALIVGDANGQLFDKGTVNLTAANTYTGATTVNSGSTLSGTVQTNPGDSPFGSATGAVSLVNGSLILASAVGGQTVVKGDSTFDGTSTVNINTSGGGSGVLSFNTLTPSANNPVLNIGNGFGTANFGVLVATSAPSPTNGTIGPNYLYNTVDFASYDNTLGFVPATGEVSAADFSTSTSSTILNLTASPTVASTANAYALRLGANGIAGAGPIVLAGGGLTAAPTTADAVAAQFQFGTGVNSFSSSSSTTQSTTLASVNASGAGASLTIANGVLAFTGSNNFLGSYVVNRGGVLESLSDAALGSATGITLNGGTLTTSSVTAGTVVLAKPITLTSAGGTIAGNTLSASSFANLQVSSTITGSSTLYVNASPGGDGDELNFNGNLSGFTGTIVNLPNSNMKMTLANNPTGTSSFLNLGAVNIIVNGGTVTPGRYTNETTTIVRGAATSFGSLAGASAGGLVIIGNSANDVTLTIGSDNTSSVYNGGITQLRQLTGQGIGSLTKTGSGTLTLNGPLSYNGTTTVSAGTLAINDSSTSPVTVSAGTLGGTGTISAAVSVAASAKIAPGNSIGTLTMTSLTLDPASISSFEVNASTNTSDKIVVNSTFAYAGTLQVTNLAGTLSAGKTWDLFDFTSRSGSSVFANDASFNGVVNYSGTDLPSLAGTGLMYDFNYVTGVLTVTTPTTVSPTPASPVVFGTSVTFTANVAMSPSVGTVTFYAGPGLTNQIGSPVSVTGGVATSSAISSLAVGSYTISAVYSGFSATGFNPSTATTTLVVNNVTTTTTVTPTPASPVTFGTSVTFAASITGSPSVGTVTFYAGPGLTNQIGSVVNVVSGSATSDAISTLAVGSYTISAVYSGGTNFAGSTGTTSFTVNSAQPAPTVTSVAPFVGPTTGGNTVVINGTDFTGVTAVNFKTTPATSFTFVSANQITAVAPSNLGVVEVVDVTVTTPGGTSSTAATGDDYSYTTPAITSIVTNGVSFVTLTGATWSSGNPQVTVTGGTSGIAAGNLVSSLGAGFPVNAVVLSVDSPTTFTLTSSPTASQGTATTITATNAPAQSGTVLTLTGATWGIGTAVTVDSTTNLVVGQYVSSMGTGFPTNAVVASVTDATHFQLSVATSAAQGSPTTVSVANAAVARDGFNQLVDLTGTGSVVQNLLVTFNMPVNLDADAFSLTGQSGAFFSSVAGVAPSNATVAVTTAGVPGTGSVAAGYTQYVLNFIAGSGTNSLSLGSGSGLNAVSTLKNGVFQLNTVGSKIHAGTSDVSVDRSDNLWSLYGAVNPLDIKITGAVGGGNDTLLVDGLALNDIYHTFGSFENVASPAYVRAFDHDLDGDIDGSDLNVLYQNFGTIWKF